MKTLGVLITSDRYLKYAAKLVTSAHKKGLAVYVYLTGTARHDIDLPEFSKVWKKAKRVVRIEKVTHLISEETDDDTQSIPTAGSKALLLFLEECDRHVVL